MTKKESVTDPPVTSLIPIRSLSSRVVSRVYTADTTSSLKYPLYPESNFELRAVDAHLSSISLFCSGFSLEKVWVS